MAATVTASFHFLCPTLSSHSPFLKNKNHQLCVSPFSAPPPKFNGYTSPTVASRQNICHCVPTTLSAFRNPTVPMASLDTQPMLPPYNVLVTGSTKGDDYDQINHLKNLLAKEFEVKDLGQLKYFLGMEIARTKNGISVSQRKYTLDLLQETGMLGCKAANTPIEPVKRSEEESVPADKDRYQSLVGKLIYLTHTRPDIAFAVSMASRYMSNPTETDMRNVNRILQYLKGTLGRGLYFQKNSNRGIEVYTDSDWAGCLSDRKSTTGYCTFVWGNMVTWRSKKQSVVARSSAEAEFRAMAHGICEGIWLKRMLNEIRIPTNYTMRIFCDNKAAISIVKNPVHHDRTKHVEIDRHFIKEKIDHKIISVNHVPSCQQTADILTKALPRNVYENIRSNLGMIDIYHPD